MSRSAFKAQVLENPTFGVYIEQEQYIRELIEAHMGSNFKTVLDVLNKYSVFAFSPNISALADAFPRHVIILTYT